MLPRLRQRARHDPQTRNALAEHVPEASFQRTVVEYAELRGWMVSQVADSRRATPGLPDLLLVRPPRVVFAELKTERGRLDRRLYVSPKTGRRLPNQEDWKLALEACPGSHVPPLEAVRLGRDRGGAQHEHITGPWTYQLNTIKDRPSHSGGRVNRLPRLARNWTLGRP